MLSKRLGTLVLALALVLPLPLVGCGGPSTRDICGAECDCEGCSNSDFDKCLVDYAADARAADYRGCEGRFDNLVDCIDATGICVGNDFKDSCKLEKELLKDCIDPK